MAQILEALHRRKNVLPVCVSGEKRIGTGIVPIPQYGTLSSVESCNDLRNVRNAEWFVNRKLITQIIPNHLKSFGFAVPAIVRFDMTAINERRNFRRNDPILNPDRAARWMDLYAIRSASAEKKNCDYQQLH